MSALWNIRTILLLPPLLVVLLATVIAFATLYHLKGQFDHARSIQGDNMTLVFEAEQLSEHTLDVHGEVRRALQGAISGEKDELQLYYIHSDVVNALAELQQRVQRFASDPQLTNIQMAHVSSFREEFENYRRFMIMATDIIAIDTTTAEQYVARAHDHFIRFTHAGHRISSELIDHVKLLQRKEAGMIERSYRNTLIYGMLGMLLVYVIVRLIARRTSQCLLMIANALQRLGKNTSQPPEMPEIDSLQQRAHGEIKTIVDALGEFRRALVDRHKQQQQIDELSYFDPLTGLANRRLLIEHLQQALKNIHHEQQHCALLFIDLDNFKDINDTIGHSAGDRVLQQVGERLVRCLSSSDTAARTGGDEFFILLEHLPAAADEAANEVKQTAERIIKALSRPFELTEGNYPLTASVGASLSDDPNDSVDQLMLNADLALYQAKSSGKNQVRFFDPIMQETVNRRTQLESDLREALNRQQLALHYQPQVNAESKVRGYEALLRWQHPEQGMISPAEFIPIAEESGQIIEIGHWVLQQACEQLVAWQDDLKKNTLSISVNVSGIQFAQEDFPQRVSRVIVNSGANPARLKLELTESMLLTNVEDTITKMRAINRIGILFSLDDFGTGYSSLSYLKHLPLSWLKIDQSFVRDMMNDPDDDAIVRTIIALSKSLGMRVIAEGVETKEQYQHLLSMGCDEFQGYYFGRPAPLED